LILAVRCGGGGWRQPRLDKFIQSIIMRAFLALYPPLELAQNYLALLNQLNLDQSNFSLTPPHQLHLTLKFLGNDLSEKQIQNLASKLREPLTQFPSFSIVTDSLSFGFNLINQPKFLLLKVKPNPNLQKLVHLIDLRLPANHPELFVDRPFVPHLTLGKAKRKLNPDEIKEIRDQISSIKLEQAFSATQVNFIQSELKRTGPKHSKILSIRFRV
jgi:2'-5' RNA ligase